ncbi:hypothetical protein KBD59_02590 [Candidatus Gracilibacteria bacterium]|nr:hypothetical protein [Candidatus Gracilibacteria bacterium]
MNISLQRTDSNHRRAYMVLKGEQIISTTKKVEYVCTSCGTIADNFKKFSSTNATKGCN